MPIGKRIEGPGIDRFDGMHATKAYPPLPGEEINPAIPVVLRAIPRVSLNSRRIARRDFAERSNHGLTRYHLRHTFRNPAVASHAARRHGFDRCNVRA